MNPRLQIANHGSLVTLINNQRDTAGLSAENSGLKMRLQNVEQQVHLQDGKSCYSSQRFYLFYFLHSVFVTFTICKRILNGQHARKRDSNVLTCNSF